MARKKSNGRLIVIESLEIRGQIEASKLNGTGAGSLWSSNALRVRRSVTWKSVDAVNSSTNSRYLELEVLMFR